MGKSKSELYLILMFCTSELGLNNSLFLANNNKENIYWDRRGKASKFLNNSWQESLLLEPIITLIILFLNFEHDFTMTRIHPK